MSDEGNDVFSGAVNTQPEMINVQPAGQMYLVEKSKAPQIIGILVLIYYVLTSITNIIALFSFSLFSDLDETGMIEEMPIYIIIAASIMTLIPAVIGIFGGYKMYLYQKMGIWIVLGSIVIGWVMGIFTSVLTASYMGADAGFSAASNGICGVFCVAVCSVIVCIPLMMATGGME
jgi:amino acid transporter|tara:strand:+ start:49 stop:573 length:525 start_codon:yes stop_codon:yes gene_type:complete